MALLGRPIAAALLAAALAFLGASPAEAHTGNRLRLGYQVEPAMAVLARITEVYVEEVSGFRIDLREFGDEGTLLAALQGGDIDLAIARPDPAWVEAACGPGKPATGLPLADHWRGRGGGLAAAFDLGTSPRPCGGPALIISPPVAGDLAYYTLPGYLRKVAGAVGPSDVEALLRADPAGTDRGAARAWLAARRLI
jgi:hypothetical protein